MAADVGHGDTMREKLAEYAKVIRAMRVDIAAEALTLGKERPMLDEVTFDLDQAQLRIEGFLHEPQLW